MTVEAVIFDMDGVIVDSEVYWAQSRVEFAAARGKQWTDADQHLAMGRSTVEWAQVMQERLGLSETVETIISEMKARVNAHYEERLPVRPGALEAIQLAAEHFRVGLASGSPTEIIQNVMRLTGLDRVFEVIIYGDSIPNGKPAPDIYLEALRQLNVPAGISLGIEDSGNGIRALKAAGMYAIAAPSPGFALPDEILTLADASIASLEEFSLELIAHITTHSS
jgi:HAD superfamily hydrolase (TIGR01509 family)